MHTVSLEEAQAELPQLIEQLAPGDELIITRDARPVAQLVALPADRPRPVPGRGRGKLVILSEGDEHLSDFERDMP